MNRPRKLLVLAAFISALAGCGASTQEPATSEPQKTVKTGWVQIWDDSWTQKRCDGTTLLYVTSDSVRAGITAIPDSSECK